MQIETLSPQFEKVLNRNEKVFWVGHPKLIPFLSTGSGFLLFGILWFCFDYFFFIRVISFEEGSDMLIVFFGIHLLPFWLSIINMIRLSLVYRNTFYACSDQRVMIRTGFFGTDYRSLDFEKISDIEVNVNPLENILGVGTIRIFTGQVTRRGSRIGDNFTAIEHPYETFKLIKQLSEERKQN